jgi:hypothetical protein
MDLPEARQRVHPFAKDFIQGLFDQARGSLRDSGAARIAEWVQHFDIHVAVKVIESLMRC